MARVQHDHVVPALAVVESADGPVLASSCPWPAAPSPITWSACFSHFFVLALLT